MTTARNRAEAENRYERFVRDVTVSRKLWALRQHGGWANWSADEGPIFPVWSDQTSAQRCADGLFNGYVPQEVDLTTFLEELLPGLRDTGYFVGINLDASMAGVDLSCDEFASQLSGGDA